jgi:hypothetical protein
MARIPILQGPGQIQTGNQTFKTPNLPAVTNEAIGQGLAKVGAVAFDIAEKAKRAEDLTNLTNASIAMQKAQLDFSTFQQSPEGQDETKWMNKWNEIQDGLKTQFDQMKLSSDARMRLQDRLTDWSTRGTIMVQADAYKQTGKRTVMAVQNAIDIGKQTNNWSSADTALQDVEKLPLPQEFKDRFNIDVNTAKKETSEKKEYDDLLLMAKPGPFSDPSSAASLAWQKAENGKLTPLLASNIQQEANQTIAVNRRDAIMFYKQKMENGGKVTAEELINDWRLGDMDKESIALLQDGKKNNMVEFEKAITEVMNFDRNLFADEKTAVTAIANLEANLESRFDGALLSNLKSELDKRTKGLSPEDAERDTGPALKFLDEEVEKGGLGPVNKPVLKDGKPVMREAKKVGFTEKPGLLWGTTQKDVVENEGKPVPVTEPDPVAREQAAAIQREIRTTLNNEVKTGTLKTSKQIFARAIDLYKMKGGKFSPVNEGSVGAGTLLPALSNTEELDQILKQNGN